MPMPQSPKHAAPANELGGGHLVAHAPAPAVQAVSSAPQLMLVFMLHTCACERHALNGAKFCARQTGPQRAEQTAAPDVLLVAVLVTTCDPPGGVLERAHTPACEIVRDAPVLAACNCPPDADVLLMMVGFPDVTVKPDPEVNVGPNIVQEDL